MAHHVVIDKIPLTNKTTGELNGKYRYEVRCKRCGPVQEGRITSFKVAASIHHTEVELRHRTQHPKDKAFQRAVRNKQKKASLRG